LCADLKIDEKIMSFIYTCIEEWPPLAWLATCDPSTRAVEVLHGSRVETRPDWFAEAVWDGDCEQADFDRTDLVFGSGGRLRDDEPIFVSSATTVDRLHSLESNGRIWVSNSLACLLAAVGGRVAPDYDGYFRDFETIIRGIANYHRTVASSAGPVRLTYYDNLCWRNDRLVEFPKPTPRRDFSTFERYRDSVEAILCQLAENARSASRTYSYRLLATISSGYDSPAVAALARRAGLRQTLSFSAARDQRPDSGAEVARRLGLEPIVVDSSLWRRSKLPEVPFLASDAKGEDVYYAGGEDVLDGTLLLTGYGGSRVWNKGSDLLADLERSDQSGLSLCEYRLWAGFLHCPVTYIGGRQTQDLRHISNAAEMAPWDVPGGYSRPICRRVLEEAGVPRQLFGMEKKAASILFFDRNTFLSEGSLADYRSWCRRHLKRSSGPIHLACAGLTAGARAAARGMQSLAGALHAVIPFALLARVRSSGRLTCFANHEQLFAHVFPWALEKAVERYRMRTTASGGCKSPVCLTQASTAG
jgi:hypothetical protein